jgi:hypothetical protein
MTDEELQALLAKLKVLTEETDEGGIAPACDLCELCEGATPISARDYTDDQLLFFLDMYDYDLQRTAYHVLLRKAQNTQITLGSGIALPDNSAYWLRLAATQRPSRTGMLKRADEPEVDA